MQARPNPLNTLFRRSNLESDMQSDEERHNASWRSSLVQKHR